VLLNLTEFYFSQVSLDPFILEINCPSATLKVVVLRVFKLQHHLISGLDLLI